MYQNSEAFNAALQIIQKAVTLLAIWADQNLANKCPKLPSEEDKTSIFYLPNNYNLKPLKLLFDRIQLTQQQTKKNYRFPKFIEDKDPAIPYPCLERPKDSDFDKLKIEIKKTVNTFTEKDWNNLCLLDFFLEKFGSFISLDESDVALVDIARIASATASAIASSPNTDKLSLVTGNLSGIQKFIYTISSDGALKSLRARSFYLELVTEEVVQQLLENLKLPRTNVIYTGGGNLYILASGTEATKNIIEKIRNHFNEWLLETFQSKIFLALDCYNFPVAEINTHKFIEHWSEATKQLSLHKDRKFKDHLSHFTKIRDSYEPCRVCHRDDEPNLQLLNPKEPDSVLACTTCCSMFQLGGQLFNVDVIVRSQQKNMENKLDTLEFNISGKQVYYHLLRRGKQKLTELDTMFLVNDWNLEHYQRSNCKNTYLLILGNYSKKNTEKAENMEEPIGFSRAGELAEKARGINRVGYLRMDVDNLGQIFAKGLGESQNLSLPRIAGLSRQMSYFFKAYLNSLAEKRYDNFIQHCKNKTVPGLQNAQYLTEEERKNLLFIYAGGDDVFISGAWNEVVEFAFDIYQCFRAYTGHNPDITISGGISIDESKFPIYQSADGSGDAEKAAKLNGKDSLGLFGQVFKWTEWLEIQDTSLIDHEIKNYLHSETKPELLGILPFVKKLEEQKIGISYSRNFVRNLLITAQIQEEALKKFNDKKSEEALGTRYYLHLPKIAYTLARLPKNVLDDEAFRTSLKSPYNAPYFRAIATWIELLNRSS